MSTPFFRFQRFTVWHDRSSMRVGTDGVLLGALCPINTDKGDASPLSILDIGTGSGLVALMLAQRTESVPARIDAIDIDPASVEQASENFAASPWSDRLKAICCAVQDYHPDTRYDIIVSNPPFFENALKAPDAVRSAARHTDTLPFAELFAAAQRLLADNGQFTLILPASATDQLPTSATDQLPNSPTLQLTERTDIFSKPGKPLRRVLLTYTLPPTPFRHPVPSFSGSAASYILLPTTFFIEGTAPDGTPLPRSEQYQLATRDFYL